MSAIPKVGATWWFDVTAPTLAVPPLAIIPGLAVVCFHTKVRRIGVSVCGRRRCTHARCGPIGSHGGTRTRSFAGAGLVALAVGATLSADHLLSRELRGHLQSLPPGRAPRHAGIAARFRWARNRSSYLMMTPMCHRFVTLIGAHGCSDNLTCRDDISRASWASGPWLASEPFVGEYRDQGFESWTVRNGRSSRIPYQGPVERLPDLHLHFPE